MQTKQDGRLGTEKIGKLMLELALPSVLAQIVNVLYNIVDRIYIGHIPGEGSLALTGVGVCMPIIMIVSAFAAAVMRCCLLLSLFANFILGFVTLTLSMILSPPNTTPITPP